MLDLLSCGINLLIPQKPMLNLNVLTMRVSRLPSGGQNDNIAAHITARRSLIIGFMRCRSMPAVRIIDSHGRLHGYLSTISHESPRIRNAGDLHRIAPPRILRLNWLNVFLPFPHYPFRPRTLTAYLRISMLWNRFSQRLVLHHYSCIRHATFHYYIPLFLHIRGSFFAALYRARIIFLFALGMS